MSVLGEKLAWIISDSEVRRPLPTLVLPILLRRSDVTGLVKIKHATLAGISRLREPNLHDKAIDDLAKQGYLHVVAHEIGGMCEYVVNLDRVEQECRATKERLHSLRSPLHDQMGRGAAHV